MANEEIFTQPAAANSHTKKTGFALLGVGELIETQILPAFEKCQHAEVVSLIGKDTGELKALAEKYHIDSNAIYSYEDFDKIAGNDKIEVVYIALPNAMHKEYTVKAAQAGKHVLCEKPLSTSAQDAQAMIDACKRANRKLMAAYRIHYEPHHQFIKELVQNKSFGEIETIYCSNAEYVGDPKQWRFDKSMAGGGVLMDLGIYCVNTVRYITGMEPVWVEASTSSTPGDPRFKEVEETVDFKMGFANGLVATCNSTYNDPKKQLYSLHTDQGVAFGMDPAFAYEKLKVFIHTANKQVFPVPVIPPGNQFSNLLDHMAVCVQKDQEPNTPGEEGLKDQRIIEAIYQSAESKTRVELQESKLFVTM